MSAPAKIAAAPTSQAAGDAFGKSGKSRPPYAIAAVPLADHADANAAERDPLDDSAHPICPRVMHRYERAVLLGVRAVALANGARSTLPPSADWDPLVIAKRELAARTMPVKLRRYRPDGTYEDWLIGDLLILDDDVSV